MRSNRSVGRTPAAAVIAFGFFMLTSLFALVAPGSAQVAIPPDAQRILRENPNLVRQQLLTSGMSQAEIRARLTAAGVPADALDNFMAAGALDAENAFDPDAIRGLQALGLARQSADGLELIEPQTGLQDGVEEETEDAGFPIFGHRAFSRATSQFQPLLSGPVPDEYRIGPDDVLLLLITGEVEAAYDLNVTREGFIVIPEVGRISVANLTMAEARALLRQRLAPSYSGVERGTTTISLSITELRTIQVYVIGEVEQSGAYQLSSVATVTNALYAAGGPTDLGNLRDVRVRRRAGADASLDLYDYLLDGDISGDITLEQGDVVFVPLKERRVGVYGAVGRPAFYDLTGAESLERVLTAAGGFAPNADRRRLTIHRVVRPSERGPGLGERVAIDLGLAASSDPSASGHVGGVLMPPIGLQDGDSIVVDRVPGLFDGYYVTISGSVARPNVFPWRDGMTLRDLMALARGPTVGADLREAEVSRLPDQRDAGELAERLRVPLDSSYLSQRDPDGRFVGPPGVTFPPAGASPEFDLSPYDHVQIHRQPDFEMMSSVRVTGEVSVPGQYTLMTKNDRVTDLLARSGRILETGYTNGARLYRAQDDLGRIDLDLPAALEQPGSTEDIVLQPGDSLHIPIYSPTVEVTGAVNSPVTVLYRDGQDFDYYVEAAGGLRRDADKGRAVVRYANGLAQTPDQFMLWSSYPEPGPGSTVTIPAKDPADRIDTRGLIGDLVAITGSLTTVILLIVR